MKSGQNGGKTLITLGYRLLFTLTVWVIRESVKVTTYHVVEGGRLCHCAL
jgi:hypothetical protein